MPTRTSEETETTKKKIIAATLKRAGQANQWQNVSLPKIATTSRLSLSAVMQVVNNRDALLALIFSELSTINDGLSTDTLGVTPRDRLLEMLLRIFDHMTPHKKAYRTIYKYLSTHKEHALFLLPLYLRSLYRIIQLAGTENTPPPIPPIISVLGLAVIHSRALQTWLIESDPFFPKTTAMLDRSLDRVDWIISKLRSS